MPIELGSDTEDVTSFFTQRACRGAASLADVHCLIGGVPAEIFAGPQGSEGLDQINLKIPPGLRGGGIVDVKVSIAGQLANTVEVCIK